MQKESRLYFEAPILKFKETLKEYKEMLYFENFQKDEVGRALVHQRYQMERVLGKIKTLKAQYGKQETMYLFLKNKSIYWENFYKGMKVSMDEKDIIINDLCSLYFEWKVKFTNLSKFTNYIIQDLPKNLQSAYEVMCRGSTPYEVFNFVRFCKRML